MRIKSRFTTAKYLIQFNLFKVQTLIGNLFIKEDKQALSEIYRTLKPNGIAIIEIPMGYYGDIEATRTVEFDKQPFYEHWRSYGFDSFFNMAFLTGFKMDNVKCFNYKDTKLGLGESPSILGFFECRK